MKQVKVFTESAVRKLIENAKAGQLSGEGVTRGPNGTTIQTRRNTLPPPMPRPTPSPILAKVTASTLMSGQTTRWVYTITQVNIAITASSGTPTATTVTARTTGPIVDAKAINLAEIANTSDAAFGVDLTGDDYPAGFAAQPIGGGSGDGSHAVDEIVRVAGSIKASDDSVIYYIERMGAHDGTCSA